MKKNVFGRKLKRDTNERKALFKSLMSSLVLKERIKTTDAKAKAVKSRIDKLVTRVKKDGLNARKYLSLYLTPDAMEKIIKEITPRFNQRQGGYTRIIRLYKRFGDDARMVLMEWTEQREIKSQSIRQAQDKKSNIKDAEEKRVTGKVKKEIKKPKKMIRKSASGQTRKKIEAD